MVTFSTLTRALAPHVNEAFEDNHVIVLERSKKPAGVLMGHDLWLIGQERAIEPARAEEMNSRRAQNAMKPIREHLDQGVHTIVTVDSHPKAVFAPYEWARELFPELGLPATPQPPESALIVYRSLNRLAELDAEFAGTPDPEFEMDRRLSAGPTRIPAIRRNRLRAVVYVHDGVVARVRTLDPHAQWEDLPGPFSLAPVSPPLTALQIERKLPGLPLRPGDKQEQRWGTWREYLDLTPAD